MNITIIGVGKIKEKYLKLGIDEFSKRLTKYCKLDVIELDDEKCPENLSEKDMFIVKDKEGKKILSKIKNNSYVIALAIDGKNLSSEELADTMSKLAVRGNSHITFVIGGSLGLSDEVLKRADYKLSFSKMTFPHQLMRLILLEQVYRAFRINNNDFKNCQFNQNVSERFILEDITFENCEFDDIDFNNVKLVNVSFVNCYLKNCDLSNQVFDKQFFNKVDFENCKLMGVSLIDTFLKNISFKDCNCQYINLFGSKINNFMIYLIFRT